MDKSRGKCSFGCAGGSSISAKKICSIVFVGVHWRKHLRSKALRSEDEKNNSNAMTNSAEIVGSSPTPFGVGAISLASGITVGGRGNGTFSHRPDALHSPSSTFSAGNDRSVSIDDSLHQRIVALEKGSLNGTVVAGTGLAGRSANQRDDPPGFAVDSSSNLPRADRASRRVMLCPRNTSSGMAISAKGSAVNTSVGLSSIGTLWIDASSSMCIRDEGMACLFHWRSNTIHLTIVAGTGSAENASGLLDRPFALFYDDENANLCVTDLNNPRIQRWQ